MSTSTNDYPFNENWLNHLNVDEAMMLHQMYRRFGSTYHDIDKYYAYVDNDKLLDKLIDYGLFSRRETCNYRDCENDVLKVSEHMLKGLRRETDRRVLRRV